MHAIILFVNFWFKMMTLICLIFLFCETSVTFSTTIGLFFLFCVFLTLRWCYMFEVSFVYSSRCGGKGFLISYINYLQCCHVLFFYCCIIILKFCALTSLGGPIYNPRNLFSQDQWQENQTYTCY